MNCIKDGKYTGDSRFGCPVKVDECEIRDKVYRKRWIPAAERLPGQLNIEDIEREQNEDIKAENEEEPDGEADGIYSQGQESDT
ncbi:hypothetical protein FYJ45_24880 [Eisenbergiella tayi]|uniref:Uncharacterized protein n=1 Tax=Eisenbergiella porci TaxID=2652274 RepID=A0A6N7W7X3_9FIRM|nr:hypothetical protein [Eisenbergiella porci]MSS91351.1 hypothetical protein [Eisenbergiella porci]